MASCARCTEPSVVFQRYSGAHLCEVHFLDSVEDRVRGELRRQLPRSGPERIVIGLSGGKDSSTTAYLLTRLLARRRDVALLAVTIDEGIAGYRDEALPLIVENCKAWDLPLTIVPFRHEYATAVDEIVSLQRELGACSYCGVLRRSALNRAARRLEATRLATGLNLDDTAQSILMNIVRGEVEHLARLGPHDGTQPGLIPRLQPLRTIPELEVALYARLRGLRVHDTTCPYAGEAMRNEFRGLLLRLEDAHPGTRHSILRTYEGLLSALRQAYPPATLRSCACGEPTVEERCRACVLLEGLGL